jgi:hypothetical protein
MNSHGFAILDEPSMVRSGSFYCWQLVAEVLLYEFSSRSQPEDFKANSGIGREKGVKKSQSFAADGNHVDDADDAVAVVDDYYYSYVIVIIYIYLYIYNYIYINRICIYIYIPRASQTLKKNLATNFRLLDDLDALCNYGPPWQCSRHGRAAPTRDRAGRFATRSRRRCATAARHLKR